jgi:hypothetical protein
MTSFNRYTKTLADYIVEHQYNEKSTLVAINDEFNALDTAVIDRQILTSDDPVDSSQIVLKPVFQFISATEPTAIPYWAGIAPSPDIISGTKTKGFIESFGFCLGKNKRIKVIQRYNRQ